MSTLTGSLPWPRGLRAWGAEHSAAAGERKNTQAEVADLRHELGELASTGFGFPFSEMLRRHAADMVTNLYGPDRTDFIPAAVRLLAIMRGCVERSARAYANTTQTPAEKMGGAALIPADADLDALLTEIAQKYETVPPYPWHEDGSAHTLAPINTVVSQPEI